MRSKFWIIFVLSIILAIALSSIPGCTKRIPHPPHFEDFRRLETTSWTWSDVDKVLEQYKAVSEASKFTPEDLAVIRRRGVTKELIGAGYQTDPYDNAGPGLIRIGIDRDPSDPVGWAALVYWELGAFRAGHLNNIIDDNVILSDLDRFEKVDGKNALPDYLRAYLYALKNQMGGADEEIQKASQKEAFSSYHLEIKKYVIAAAESVGYPPYTARVYAFSNWSGSWMLLQLSEMLLEGEASNRQSAEACLLLGKRLEVQSKVSIETLIALAIQSRSIRRLSEEGNNKDLEIINDKKNSMKDYRLTDVSQVPESRWVQYYDDILSIGEASAMQKLYAEYGKSP